MEGVAATGPQFAEVRMWSMIFLVRPNPTPRESEGRVPSPGSIAPSVVARLSSVALFHVAPLRNKTMHEINFLIWKFS